MGWYSHSHPPDWLARNGLFRKVYLLIKLFFIRRTRRHYGQMAEDVAIDRYFAKDYKGLFVDVGCFHPVKHSNTYRLYRRGWRGVNIDIDPIKIEGFDLLRPGDTNLARAVSNEPGERTMWTNGFYSLVVTLDEATARSRHYDYRPRPVTADTLTNILDGTTYRDRPIDLLTVDAEGHDLEVLASLDFDRYQPRLVLIESLQRSLSALEEDEIYRFLSEKGYELVNWVGLTVFFQKKS